MPSSQPMPLLIPAAANDLPAPPSAERARLRTRERKLRGPAWRTANDLDESA